MHSYRPPVREMLFVLRDLAGVDDESAEEILTEGARFASEFLAPLNVSGDREGCTLRDGAVTTPRGFKEAYAQFAQAGWIGVAVPEAFGGQGLPGALLAPLTEMWNAANPGFANAPMLNSGAIEAIELAGSPEQKRRYLPKLVSGEWAGTMCLTEPQAGSDLAAVRTQAVPEGDRYRIKGQKIFITFGEHDLTENIVHLVLARLPGAPAGTKGISLFIVPKYVVGEDGSLGERNDVVCAALEHKLGLHGNPTCTLNYGERTGALAELVGEPDRGLEYMFIMMNSARLSVGIQALGIADRAYRSALAYAKERVQFRDVASGSEEPVPILRHPDVRRMLATMKARLEAMRALAYVTAASPDRSFVDFMIPVVKGWCTESAIEICSTALQVYGGAGYIEETGIAQQLRDVRIMAIYEGTTGIQALDLVGRKLLRDRGAVATEILGQMARDCASSPAAAGALALLTEATRAMGTLATSDLRLALASSVPYLKLWGVVAGGWQSARAAALAGSRVTEGGAEASFYEAKSATARVYAGQVLPEAAALAQTVKEGAASVLTLAEEQFELDLGHARTRIAPI